VREIEQKIYWLRSFLIIIGLFLVWLVGRPFVAMMLARFEQTAFEQVVRQLNLACQARVIEAKSVATMSLYDWPGSNPVNCLSEQGMSGWDYRDEESTEDSQQPGTWVFDETAGELRYRLEHPGRVINQDPEPDLIRFRLTADFADSNGNNELDNNEPINGLYLKTRYRYQWQ
jgi:hypothetical protein